MSTHDFEDDAEKHSSSVSYQAWDWVREHGSLVATVLAVLTAAGIFFWLLSSDEEPTSSNGDPGSSTSSVVTSPAFPLIENQNSVPSNGHELGLSGSVDTPQNSGHQPLSLPADTPDPGQLRDNVSRFLGVFYSRDVTTLTDVTSLDCGEALKDKLSQEQEADIQQRLSGYIQQLQQVRDSGIDQMFRDGVLDEAVQNELKKYPVSVGYTYNCGLINARGVLTVSTPWDDQLSARPRGSSAELYLETPLSVELKGSENGDSIQATVTSTPLVPKTEWHFAADTQKWVLVYYAP